MILNLKKGSKGLNENMEAAKSNFLLRGYFKKKEKEEKAKENKETPTDKNPEKKQESNKETTKDEK